MDPNACLERLRIAYGENHWGEIRAASEDLIVWIAGGGFLPTPTEPQMSAMLQMAQCYGHDRKDDTVRTKR